MILSRPEVNPATQAMNLGAKMSKFSAQAPAEAAGAGDMDNVRASKYLGPAASFFFSMAVLIRTCSFFYSISLSVWQFFLGLAAH